MIKLRSEDGPIDRVEVAFGGQVESWESGDELPTCSDFSPVSLEFPDSGPVKLTLCENADVVSVFAHVPNAGALDLLLQGGNKIDTPPGVGTPSLQVWDGDLNIYGAEEGTQPPKVLEISAEENEDAIELQGGFALSVGKPGTPSVIVDVLDGWAPSPNDVVIAEGNEYLYEGADDPGGHFDGRLNVSGEEFDENSQDLPVCGEGGSPFGVDFDGDTPILTLCGEVEDIASNGDLVIEVDGEVFARNGGQPDAIDVDGDLTIYGVDDSDRNVLNLVESLAVHGPEVAILTIGKTGTMVTVNVEGHAPRPDDPHSDAEVRVIPPSVYNPDAEPSGPPFPEFDGVRVNGEIYENDHNVDQCSATAGDKCFAVQFRDDKAPLVTLKGITVEGIAAAVPLDVFVAKDSTVKAPADMGPGNGEDQGGHGSLGLSAQEPPHNEDGPEPPPPPMPPGSFGPAAIDVFDTLTIYGPTLASIDDLPEKADDAAATLTIEGATPSSQAVTIHRDMEGVDEGEHEHHKHWGYFTVGTLDTPTSVLVDVVEGFGPPYESVHDRTRVFDGSFYVLSGEVEFGHDPQFGHPVKTWIGTTLVVDDEKCFDGEDWAAWDCNPFVTNQQGVGDGFKAEKDDKDNWIAKADDGSWEMTPNRLKHINPVNQTLGYGITFDGEIDPVFTTGGAPDDSGEPSRPHEPMGQDRGLSVRGESPDASLIRAATAQNTPQEVQNIAGATYAGCSLFGFESVEWGLGHLDLDGAGALGGVCTDGDFGFDGARVGTANTPSNVGVRASSLGIGEGASEIYSQAPALELTGADRPEVEVRGSGAVLKIDSSGPGDAVEGVDRFTVEGKGEVEVNYPDGKLTDGKLELCAFKEPVFGQDGPGGPGEPGEADDVVCFDYPSQSGSVAKVYDYELRGTAPDYSGFTLKSLAAGMYSLDWPIDAANGQARIALVGEYEGFFSPGYMQDYHWLIKEGSTVTLKVQPLPGYQLTSTKMTYYTPGSHGNQVEGELELTPVIDGDNVAWYTFTMPSRQVDLDIQLENFGSSAIVSADVQGISSAEMGALPRGTVERGFGGTGRLDVEDATVSDVSDFEEAAKGLGGADTDFEIGEYLDLEVNQVILQGTDDPAKAWVDEEPITELRYEVPVTLSLDGNLAGYGQYKVLRKHGDDIDVLDAEYEGGKLTFKTDQFSTYAIAYDADSLIVEKPDRIAGKDRYATNLALLKDTHKAGDPIFVATGALYPDALSVGPAVAMEGGNLVLTPKKAMRQDTLSFLTANKPSKIWIVGGTGAVSTNVERQLKKLAPVERVKGANRYETSLAVFNKFFKDSGTTEAFVATGSGFPDALTASAAGGSLKAPVLLVKGAKGKSMLPAMSSAASKAGVKKMHIVGGTGAVNKQIQSSLTSSGFTVDRLGGADRYATNNAVNEFLGTKDTVGVWIATGANFPDALSAAVPAAAPGQRLVLAKKDCIPAVSSWVTAKGSRVSQIHLVGGTGVLSKKVEQMAMCPK